MVIVSLFVTPDCLALHYHALCDRCVDWIKHARRSCQLIEQRPGILQVRRIETFGEPIVDRIEQITAFRAFALVTPEPGEADRCPQLQELCALPLGNSDRLAIMLLCRGLIAGGIQQIARHPMQQFSFADPLIGSLDDPRSLGEAVPFFSNPRPGRRPPRAT